MRLNRVRNLSQMKTKNNSNQIFKELKDNQITNKGMALQIKMLVAKDKVLLSISLRINLTITMPITTLTMLNKRVSPI